jgi:hypothetical protein
MEPREPDEVLAPMGDEESMVDLLKGGYAIQKAGNETLAQMSLARPRVLAKVLKDTLDELEAFPDFARKQFYRMEWGKGDNRVVIEGTGIDGAMMLLRNFKYMRAGALPLQETDNSFTYVGSCLDLQSGIQIDATGTVSKMYRQKKTGKMVQWRVDQHTQLRQKAASIAVRNAILKVIPQHIKAPFFQRAKELAGQAERHQAEGSARAKAGGRAPSQKQVDAAKVAQVLKYFEPMGVNKKHLQIMLAAWRDKKSAKLETMSDEELGRVRGVFNAIRNGQSDVYKQFGIGGPGEVKDEGVAAEMPDDPIGDAEPTDA